MNLLEETELMCPYCGERFTVLVDCSVTEQSYVEDCQVCCQPIMLDVQIGEDEAVHVQARREDE